MPRLVARWPDETVIDKVAPRHTCHSMWKERRDCQRELESNLLPVRTWAGLLGPAGGVAHLHAVVSARRPAQTGMDRWTCGPCRHHRPRRRDLSHASGYRHQRDVYKRQASPRFAVRGLLPWPDFLNCISIYNDEDFKAYFASMLRMRFNMFGMHVYTENAPGPQAESYLSFDFAGSGHGATLEDTTMTSWGYLPQRTSTFKMGGARFFDTDTFGADATRLGADTWDIARRTTAMLSAAFSFAGALGIRTGIGFEPYRNPAEIVRALPPEAISHPGGFMESRTARDLLERRLADLLERYPMVDYVWLWEDENANWEGRARNVPLSITPFVQARDFLKQHAPGKRLVLAGWGGVTRHFESLHQRLPEDIVFSALSDSLGWDPVNEAFGKLGGRERWPIPWLSLIHI